MIFAARDARRNRLHGVSCLVAQCARSKCVQEPLNALRGAVTCVGPLRKNGYPLRSALFDVPTVAFVRGGCIDRLLRALRWSVKLFVMS
jgi:hypothetical protein